MPDSNPSFSSRMLLACQVFFGILANAELAAKVRRLREGQTASPSAPNAAASTLAQARPDAALQLLGLLQRDGRFIDFMEEEVAAYSDAQIGAAARVVHDGCRKTLREHFTINPVREEPEGSRIVLNESFDASAIRLTGNVVGKAPFRGSLSHRGWRVTEVRLPKLAGSHDASVVAPAEVEL